jgi:dTDP-4-amino-4,6-dideoxygalactose transaminase
MPASRITRGRRDRYLVFGAPAIGTEEIEGVVAALESGWIGTGPRVAEFEAAFASYKGASDAAAVNSCTAALHLSLLAANLSPGDEVITTPLTFVATINAILHAGGVPVLADVDPATMNIDVAHAASLVTPRTRALLPVHFAGRPCEMSLLTALARQHDLVLIEDCAHAVETEYQGQPAGTFGDFGCFSFYVTKNVAAGEGGMVLAKDADALAHIKTLALHGMSKDAWKRFSDSGYKHYDLVGPGFKYNMMDLQAAIAIPQLERVEKNWLRRRDIWDRYDAAFADLPVTRPAPVAADTRHAFHLFTLLVDESLAGIDRDTFMQRLDQFGIGVGVHYRSVTEYGYYRERFGWSDATAPNAAAIGSQTVSLPLSPALSDTDVEDTIDAVVEVLAEAR